MWVRLDGPMHDPGWEVTELDLEEIALAYMGRRRRDSELDPVPGPAVSRVTGAVR